MNRAFLILLTVLISSCAGKETLPPQKMVGEIRIEQTYPKIEIAIITDKSQVQAVIEFINSKREGWSVPWYGPPVGQIYLQLYEEEKFVGNFYVGPYFFGRDYGNFWSQSASKSEIEALGRILGINLLELISESE